MDQAYLQASRELGLTARQAELLCAALRPDAVSDLARALGRDHSSVSRLVDRAANRGLLHRRAEDSDGRVSVVELTPEGRRLAERFIKALESRTEPLLATWSGTRRRAAVETLTELAETLEASLTQTARGDGGNDGGKRSPRAQTRQDRHVQDATRANGREDP